MPCNAWNHPANCNCNWGGQGNPSNLRRNPQVNRKSIKSKKSKKLTSYDWIDYGSLTFMTNCWWCGESVFFHRNENGGCVLFDELGSPWPVHKCWTENKGSHSDAAKILLGKRKAELSSVNTKNLTFISDEKVSYDIVIGFIIGFDASFRIVPGNAKNRNPKSFLRCLVIKMSNGDLIKILAPEDRVKEIVMCSYAKLKLKRFRKNGKLAVYCLREVQQIDLKSNDSGKLLVDYDYFEIMGIGWTYQSNSM